MVGSRFMNININMNNNNEQDDSAENSPENSSGDHDSPRSAVYDTRITCTTSSPKRSRRSIQKRVVSVPIKDIEGSRLMKGEMGAPPSDSWAWRKYGQKPIKGSPYPRGYYRCSSSKGCPARKQVERSRLDPTMLVVTYSCDHNHPWPTPRNTTHNHHHTTTTPATGSRRKVNNNNAIRTEPTISEEEQDQDQDQEQEQEQEQEQKPTSTTTSGGGGDDESGEKFGKNLEETTTATATTMMTSLGDELYYGCNWLSDLLVQDRITTSSDDADVMDDMAAMVFTMRDGDDNNGEESFFADLGLLPECSTVFRRRGMMEREELHQYQYQNYQYHHRQNLAHWCGTTS